MQRFECEGKITAKVTLKYGKCELPKPVEVKFDTRESTRFGELSVLQLSETFGIAFALILASVAGFQSDAFEAALVGTWRAYLTLFVWGGRCRSNPQLSAKSGQVQGCGCTGAISLNPAMLAIDERIPYTFVPV